MTSTPTTSVPLGATTGEGQRLELNNVSWDQYCAVREALDHIPGLRMTYVEGSLAIMTPGREHERDKTLFGRLIEAYAFEKGLDLSGYGSTTFKKKKLLRGLEPDECYSLGEMGAVPELACEIVFTGEGPEKLEAYSGLGIREVLFWQKGRFELYRQAKKKGYETVERSLLFPDLDLTLLASFMRRTGSQSEVVRAFVSHLRSR